MRKTVWAMAVFLAVAAGTTVVASPALAKTDAQVVAAAAAYGPAHGYTVGVAVVDRRTGAVHLGGSSGSLFVCASVVKVLIATRILLAGKMHGTTAAVAYKMITQSDNAATDRLYPLAGREGMLPWLEQHYALPHLGTPTASPGAWGLTKVRPSWLAVFYERIAGDPKVAPWLLNAMHHAAVRSSAGVYQFWGLPSAATHVAVKQGWLVALGSANVNTTGFVDGDRYAVVIMSRGPSSTYLTAISRMITQTARLLLPGGVFPERVPGVTTLSARTGPSAGGTRLVVTGFAFTGVTAVYFGTVRARTWIVRSSTTIVVTAPPHPAGSVDVVVRTTHGDTPSLTAGAFRYTS